MPFSLEFSQCWCSSTADYGVHGEGVCDVPCTGDSGEMCGGYYAISVYSRDWDGDDSVDPVGEPIEEPTDDPAYLGCFGDVRGSRTFGLRIVEQSMTMTTEVNCLPQVRLF